MRAFLIFVALMFPLVLASPYFWSLVRAEWTSERVGFTDRQGVTQWASIGPKSPWPAWAIVPSGASLTVHANFEPAPGHSAMGYGDIGGKAAARDAARRYEAALRNSGWKVRVWRIESRSASLPPRPVRWCVVEGRRGHKAQRLTLDIDERSARGKLNWFDGNVPALVGGSESDCWGSAPPVGRAT